MNVTKKGKSSMGLAAGQARLLTITGRKSDCEYESMRLSHQKLALSRQLTDLSNEYQNSLDQTKLIYDYYGTGDQSNPLSYGILMTPSTLNNYMPVLVTDPKGRATLNSKYAAAAEAAGIPQEGLGSLPSENTRNKFIEALGGQGVISDKLMNTILGLPYNQAAGIGGGTTVAVQTKNVKYDELAELLNGYTVTPTDTVFNSEITRGVNLYNTTGKEYYRNPASSGDGKWDNLNGTQYKEASNGQVGLGDILTGNYVLVAYGQDERNSAFGATGGAIDAIVNSSAWEDMFDAVDNLLGLGDSYTKAAIEYARSQVSYMVSNQCDTSKGTGSGKRAYFNDDDLKNFAYRTGGADQAKDKTVVSQALSKADDYVGLVCRFNCGKGKDDDSDITAISINMSNVLRAYITYVEDYINGVSKTDASGNDLYSASIGRKEESSFVTSEKNYLYTIKTGATVSSDDCAQATFYNALFNQICQNGWTKNDKIDDNEYMQEMLKSGMLYISTVNDDGYYYQGNYATDSYIKEVSDDTKIAQAEAKYNTEKSKLNSKEETLDLKMKNLDTEISSLTTEYDTVKNTIAKNIEKSFKRYNA